MVVVVVAVDVDVVVVVVVIDHCLCYLVARNKSRAPHENPFVMAHRSISDTFQIDHGLDRDHLVSAHIDRHLCVSMEY